MAPIAHGMGQTCQGLSQSKGIGKAPSHAPISVNTMEHWKYASGVASDQALKNILGTSSICAPSKLQAGRTTRRDISKAQQNVSSLCSKIEAPNNIAIRWNTAADPNTNMISLTTCHIVNFIRDFIRMRVKHNTENTIQNSLSDTAVLVINDVDGEA